MSFKKLIPNRFLSIFENCFFIIKNKKKRKTKKHIIKKDKGNKKRLFFNCKKIKKGKQEKHINKRKNDKYIFGS